MKKLIKITTLLATLLILTACRPIAEAPPAYPTPTPQATQTPSPATPSPTLPPATHPQTTTIQVQTASEDLLSSFTNLHHFDYTHVRQARYGGASAQAVPHPATLVISSANPLAYLEILLIGHDFINEELVFIPIESFNLITYLPPSDALVITGYISHGTLPWSGITFIDETDTRLYFAIQENMAYPEGSGNEWDARVFENRNDSLPEGWYPGRLGPQFANREANRWLSAGSAIQSGNAGSPQRDAALAASGISQYGWQVAANFLRDFTSIFTGVGMSELAWDNVTNTAFPTGRYVMGWCRTTNQMITTYEQPEIYRILHSNTPYSFFDRDGNAITSAPWLYRNRFEDYWDGEVHVSYSHHYANYFMLFDFDGIGILDIVVHFQQTFEGCYGGFYEIFRYANGAYHRMERVSYVDGAQHGWTEFGSIHELFIDANGRIIVFTSSEMIGSSYQHLILTGNRAEFHRLAMPAHEWEEWQAHHWMEWEHTPDGHILVASWRDYLPVIFGTDIALTPLYPFADLGDELHMYLSRTQATR